MAEDLNNVSLVGRLTRNAELTYTRNEQPLIRFSLAVNRRRKDGDNWIDEGHFFDMIFWGGRRAESLHRYLIKGQQVGVTGQLRQDRWEQDGQRRSRIVVEVANVYLLGGRNETSQDYGDPAQQSTPLGRKNSGFTHPPPAGSNEFKPTPITPPHGATAQSESEEPPIRDFEDDIPF